MERLTPIAARMAGAGAIVRDAEPEDGAAAAAGTAGAGAAGDSVETPEEDGG